MPRKAESTANIKTHSGYPLTAQEARFIDLYVSGNSIRQSVIQAYPNTPPKSASNFGTKLMKTPHIKEEITYRFECSRDKSIADAREIMQYFTGVLRGEVKDAFGLDAPLSERTRAAVELSKRLDILEFSNKEEGNEIKITLDWGQGDKNKNA